jgi:uncharacterized protein (TIGR02246 family)
MRTFLIAFALSATVATGTTASAAAARKTATPVEVVRASFAALNRGDAAASAGYFAPDGQLITPLGGCNPCTGRTVIQEHLSAAVTNGVKVTVVGKPKVKGSTVVVRTEVRGSRFPPGVERAIGVFRSTVRKGLITAQKNDYDRSDPQTAALLTVIEQATGTPST